MNLSGQNKALSDEERGRSTDDPDPAQTVGAFVVPYLIVPL